MNSEFNLGLFVLFALVCAILISWITKLRRENTTKDQKIIERDEEIAIKSRAIEYQKKIIGEMAKKSANGKHG